MGISKSIIYGDDMIWMHCRSSKKTLWYIIMILIWNIVWHLKCLQYHKKTCATKHIKIWKLYTEKFWVDYFKKKYTTFTYIHNTGYNKNIFTARVQKYGAAVLSVRHFTEPDTCSLRHTVLT